MNILLFSFHVEIYVFFVNFKHHTHILMKLIKLYWNYYEYSRTIRLECYLVYATVNVYNWVEWGSVRPLHCKRRR